MKLTGLFEAELLCELMLRYWQHPLVNDGEFRQSLLERAAEVLRSAIAGERHFEDLNPKYVNLVAALWYAEWSSVSVDHESPRDQLDQRVTWLETVRRSVPSCFCDPELLA